MCIKQAKINHQRYFKISQKLQKNINQKNETFQKTIEKSIQKVEKLSKVQKIQTKQSSIKSPTKIQSKPVANALYVQKQDPVLEQNIFKGQNNFKRPSSRLVNTHHHQLKNSKPKSSNKSSQSKKSSRSKSSIGEKSIGKPQSDNKSQAKVNNEIKQQKTENLNQFLKQSTLSAKNPSGKQSQIQQQLAKDIQQQLAESQQNLSPKPAKQANFQYYEQKQHLPSPFRLAHERPIRKKSPIQSILTNPYIKKAFSHICKQSYIGGGKTFDQIAQSSDIMSLNKWMVFCKEFGFLVKLKKKALVDIYQQASDMKPTMTQQQFLNALIILQSKLRVDQQDFIKQNMCLDSEFAFREKVASFKVNYAGAKYNCFQEATIKPIDKYYQRLRQQKHQKQKQKQKYFILHQGKFQQQIQSQLSQRKNIRQLKHLKGNLSGFNDSNKNKILLNSSLTKDSLLQNSEGKSPYLRFLENKSKLSSLYTSGANSNNPETYILKTYISRKIDPLKYSDIFTQKHSVSTRAVTTNKKSSTQSVFKEEKIQNPDLSPKISASRSKIPNNSNINSQNLLPSLTQQKSQQAAYKQSINDEKPRRQWTEPIKNWAQQFDKSDSDQSDDILRQHLISQKQKQNLLPQKMPLSRIMEEYNKNPKQLSDDQIGNSQWQRQTQLQSTNKKQRFK